MPHLLWRPSILSTTTLLQKCWPFHTMEWQAGMNPWTYHYHNIIMDTNLGYKCKIFSLQIIKYSEFMSHLKMEHNAKPKNTILFRLQIAILHFNENSDREQATLQDGTERFNIAFPKYKKGEHTVKKILVKCTYGELWMKKSSKLKFTFFSLT